MSTVFTSTWSYVSRKPFFQQSRFLDTRLWRLVFALGLILGAALWWTWLGPTVPLHTSVPLWQLGVGGVLVGFGARLGNGCTSGHGICGLSSLQLPSLVAVLTFMATGFVTANVGAIPVGITRLFDVDEKNRVDQAVFELVFEFAVGVIARCSTKVVLGCFFIGAEFPRSNFYIKAVDH